MGGAAIADSGGSRGKKALDAELNLVPFIDLLCSLISFLLATAVWTQIARLELKQGNAAPPDPNTPPPEKHEADLRVEVLPASVPAPAGSPAAAVAASGALRLRTTYEKSAAARAALRDCAAEMQVVYCISKCKCHCYATKRHCDAGVRVSMLRPRFR